MQCRSTPQSGDNRLVLIKILRSGVVTSSAVDYLNQWTDKIGLVSVMYHLATLYDTL